MLRFARTAAPHRSRVHAADAGPERRDDDGVATVLVQRRIFASVVWLVRAIVVAYET